MDFDGKRVVITGGTSGFGLVTAARLVEGGAQVIVTGRDQGGVDDAQGQLGDRATVICSDVTSAADRDALASRAADVLGEIDLLFANAGITVSEPFEQTPESDYDRVFGINAKGPYFVVQQLAPMLASGGSVVLTTSVANVKGLPTTSAYAASKAAVRSMTRTMARELLPRNVRVNAVSPGPIDTGILDRSLPSEVAERTKTQMRANNPMQRFGTSDEIAQTVLFLAFAATFTTGAEIPVDGGASQLN